MKLQMIFGLTVTLVALVLATILLWKYLELSAEEKRREKEAIRSHYERIINDRYRIAFEEEHARREKEHARRKDAEFKLDITQRELKRSRDLMEKVKLAKIVNASEVQK